MKNFTVRTVPDKNRLRLEWVYQGQRRILYLGLADTKSNRIKAREIALQIEADIECGLYDTSLSKYKKNVEPLPALSSTQLFDLWLQSKCNNWDNETFRLRSYLKSDLSTFFGVKIDRLTQDNVKSFYQWLNTRQLAPDTFNRKLDTFETAWEWLLENKYVAENPWHNLPRRRIPKNPKSKPFSKTEIRKIIQAFENHKLYANYAPFVKFLFGTGCRIGEAIGVRWQDIDLVSGKITIAEQITSRQRKVAKAGSSREFYLSAGVRDLLAELKAITPVDQDLIFSTVTGKVIDSHVFRERVWIKILVAADVPYRKPSNTRHTFCSHALEQGMNPITVAAITGHDPKVLFDRYAGLIGKPQAPEFF
ncbi:tyrosine-type recombinase/integrase [Microcoleus sp. C2C3]|uniref:tyrosine-type recombinase/integrase n=1 Tax=unclassified Microcoleus TaxID=2642155 RepID=UPI002FD3F466